MGERMRYRLTQPVFLIGFMGAGKTTLARRLARECGLASVDLDRAMERRHGVDAKDLVYELGEERFRELEADELERYATGEPLIIACGGGSVLGERTQAIIRERGFALYVHVTPSESAARISNHSSRPFFEDMRSVREANRLRVPVYERLADATVDSNGKTSGQMASEVRRVLIDAGVLVAVQDEEGEASCPA